MTLTPIHPDYVPVQEGAVFDRILMAQDPVFATALADLRSGKKVPQWMWFDLPTNFHPAAFGVLPRCGRTPVSGGNLQWQVT